MKHIHYLAIVAAALSCVPAIAKERGQDVTITARPLTVDEWSRGIGKQLDRNLRYPTAFMGRSVDEGIVAVRFVCGPSGEPAGLVLQRTSGSRALDHAAMRAIAKLNTLHPMPQSIGAGQRMLAMVMFAATPEEHDRQVVRAGRYAQEQIALGKRDPTQVAMIVGASAVGS